MIMAVPYPDGTFDLGIGSGDRTSQRQQLTLRNCFARETRGPSPQGPARDFTSITNENENRV